MKMLCLATWIFAFGLTAHATDSNTRRAPNGPGGPSNFSNPMKQGFLAGYQQNLWATIADGILTEVYYPTLDRSQTQSTRFVFVMPDGRVLDEGKDLSSVSVTRYPQTLAFKAISEEPNVGIKLTKDFVLDPDTTAVAVRYQIELRDPAHTQVFLIHNSAVDNTLGGDGMRIDSNHNGFAEITAEQSDRRGDEPDVMTPSKQILIVDRKADDGTVGFLKVNDPLIQLRQYGQLRDHFDEAVYGNVSAALKFKLSSARSTVHFVLALAPSSADFDDLRSRARVLFNISSENLITAQRQQWHGYLAGLNDLGQKREVDVLVLKGLEDRNFWGSLVASPTNPSLPYSVEASETNYDLARRRQQDANGGYRRVWPRDLVQMGLGLAAAGDKFTPLNILRFLKRTQLANGTWSQNMWVDGTPSWTGFQIDQTGFPIILTSYLVEQGLANYSEFRSMVKHAADALVDKGPFTDQERWEENNGISPNSLAIACQGLVEASWLEKSANNTKLSKTYSDTCDTWKNTLLTQTFVTKGPLGENYFERIETDGNPDTGSIFIQNKPAEGEYFRENEIVDGGFLQWILSGLFPADDWHFKSTLQIYDRVARAPSVGGMGYLRYNHDAYGLGHHGGAWPLLSGERALASLLMGEDPQPHVNVLMSSTNNSEMLCEQSGISACPLGWAHAAALIVQRSLNDGRSFYIINHKQR